MTEHTDVPDTSAVRPTTVGPYCENLVLALRLHEVPGRRIGAVLAEVRDHVASSGEDPVDVFGTPQEFADALTAERPPLSRAGRLLEVGRNAAGTAGLLWVLEGGTALVSGRAAVLTEFQLVLPVVIALAAPALVDAVARARGAALVGWGALIGVLVAAGLVASVRLGPLLSVPAPAVAVLVPGLLVAGVWIVTTARSADPVIAPLQDAATTRRGRRRDSALLVALMLLPLIVAVVVLVALRDGG